MLLKGRFRMRLLQKLDVDRDVHRCYLLEQICFDSHQSENLEMATKYARRVFLFRIFAAKNSQNLVDDAGDCKKVDGTDPAEAPTSASRRSVAGTMGVVMVVRGGHGRDVGLMMITSFIILITTDLPPPANIRPGFEKSAPR